MNLPCPHCGSEESFDDRDGDDIKPIVPVEVQGDFADPPPLVKDAESAPDSANEEISEPSLPPPSSGMQSKEPPPSSPPAVPEPSSPSTKPQERPAPVPPAIPEPSSPSAKPQERPAPAYSPESTRARDSGSFRGPAVGAAAALATIEKRLGRMENSYNDLQDGVKAILQSQRAMEAFLEELREKEDAGKKGKKTQWEEVKEKDKDKKPDPEQESYLSKI